MDSKKMDFMSFMMSLNDPNSPFYVPKYDFEIVPFEGTKHGVKLYNGHLLPMVTRNPVVTKNMDVRASDTFVVTFPKSGTHWVSEIVWLIEHNLDFEKARNVKHGMRSPFIDIGFPNTYLTQLVEDPRVFSTHFPIDMLPDDVNKKAKIVYVARNPKDVLVSLFFFHKTIPDDEYLGSFEDLFKEFISGRVMYDAWWDHVNSFTQLENVHVVHYEDLKVDPVTHVRELAKYLGKNLTDDQIKSVVDFCSFDKLKNSPAFEVKIRSGELGKNIFGVNGGEGSGKEENKKEENHGQSENKMKEMKIFRKGEIGDWKNYFTDEMSKRLDEVVAAKLTYKRPFRYEP